MKKRILIVPNVSWWIIADIARQVMSRFESEWEFVFVPETILEIRRDFLLRLLDSVDCVHAMNESAAQIIVNSNPPRLPPMITWIHHVTSWSPAHKIAVEHSRMIVTCTEGWAKQIQQICPDRAVVVVRHGVDAVRFQPSRGAVRSLFGIPEKAFCVGFAATRGSDLDNSRKGVDTLVRVLERVRPDIPHMHVLFAGPGWNDIVQRLNRAGIPARALSFLAADRLASFYSSLDVYLMTSRVEGGPCTVLEAMACEVPVVATRVGLVPDVIRDGINGFSAEVDSVAELAAPLLALSRSRSLGLRLGRQARIDVQKNHTWAGTLEALRAPYETVLAGQPAISNPLPWAHWLNKPVSVLKAMSSADVLFWMYRRLRTGNGTSLQDLRRIRPMLQGLSLMDIVHGLRLLALARL